MRRVTIGVLGVQGDVAENVSATRRAMEEMNQPGDVVPVAGADIIPELDGIILPGGESTTIGQMSRSGNILKALSGRIESGMPAFGICAGMVLLAKSARDRVVGETGQALLGLLDAEVERNSFGRQRQSFERDVDIEPLGISGFRCVFIRAPSVAGSGPGVGVLASLDGRTVAVNQGNILATAFHPELTQDMALHRHFVGMVQAAVRP